MRVLRGHYKGRKGFVPEGIRPVAIRVRKSCFDMLSEVLPEARVLDLFAGSGSLGVEALSCGATGVVFIDAKKECVEAIEATIAVLGLDDRACVYRQDVERALQILNRRNDRFDCVFVDPPYYKGTLKKVLPMISEYDIVAPSGYIVAFGYHKDEFVKDFKGFSLIVQKTFGQTQISIYQNNV